ncbi:MAG: 2-amino-4-hydroxy-6-hydroxymethyldihydropteridine diphosphokinase [Arenicellales bacterium]
MLCETPPDEPVVAYVGLGSNLGDGPATLRTAIAAIDLLPRTRVARRSSFYRSPPMGVVSQPWFINAVVQVRTRLTAPELLAELQKIERRCGRVRKLRWGPRTLDLDILLYGDSVTSRPELTIPHPGVSSRAFVLYPLLEIAPNLEIPRMGSPASLVRQYRGPLPVRLPTGPRGLSGTTIAGLRIDAH